MKKKILLASLFLLALLETDGVKANIDLIVESPEELKELYEDGVYRHQAQEEKKPRFLSKKVHEKTSDDFSLKPQQGLKLSEPAYELSSKKKRDPIFDDVSALESAISEDAGTDNDIKPESPASTSAIKDIVTRVAIQTKKPSIEPDKLQGLVLVGGEDFIYDPKTAKLYAEERSLNSKHIQIIGFDERMSGIVRDIFPIITPYLGQEISLKVLDEITVLLKEQIRTSNIPFTNIYAPPQDIKEGVVYFVIKPALVEDVRIAKSEYFNELRILNKIEQELGEPVDTRQLEEDLAVLSLHPDRQIKATFSPGESDNTTRIDIDVEEQNPWRVYATRSNDGSEDLDKTLMAFGGYHNNLWGMDHRASYQYTTSADRKSLKAHNFEYNLPYYDIHSFVMRYTRSKTQISVLDDAFESRGDFLQLGFRHKSEFIGRQEIVNGWSLREQKLSIGVDKKRIEGDILFALFGDPLDTGVGADVEVFNTALDYEGVLNDPYQGRTKLRANLIYSPGSIGSKNNDEDFVTARADTQSSYSYLRFVADRNMPLPYNIKDKPLSLKTGLQGQVSPNRLIGSERFINSYRPGFRGYKSGDLSGDSGIAGYIELETSPYNFVANKYYNDALKVSVFTDFGTFFNNDASDLEDKRSSIFSVGGALQYQINSNINSQLVVAQDVSGQDDDVGQRFMYKFLFGY